MYGVGGQKRQKNVNVVCECVHLSISNLLQHELTTALNLSSSALHIFKFSSHRAANLPLFEKKNPTYTFFHLDK